jgi:hypothetical protein
MKNIHLIKTDKPSRLWSNNLRRRLELDEFPSQHPTNIAKHIYIISDEEIKEGDWYENNGVIFKADDVFDKGNNPNNSNPKVTDFNIKIILTTDQDLIKDGVQAIDDEFLEWFVHNPSCEEVETKLVEFEVDMELGDSCIEYGSYYEIIIPKEEATAYHYLSCCRSIEECHCGKYPKQIKCYCGHTITCDCSPIDELTQETLEKAAHKMLMDYGIMSVGESINVLNVKKLMVLFAKLQQERSYSEEEVLDILDRFLLSMVKDEKTGLIEKWFEQFKKK